MFGDINRVTLMGNVTKDPDLRFTPAGAPVISFSIATNRRYKKGEEWVDEPSFHNVVVWNQAEQLGQRVHKGTRIYIEGRIQTRSWDGADGKKQYKTEVVADRVILISRFEGSNDDGAPSAGGSSAPKASKSAPAEAEPAGEDEIDPNDLPF
ncbi:MAG: single-stranded DNA-binding protein [Candidatus Dojkabacteria bacterium]